MPKTFARFLSKRCRNFGLRLRVHAVLSQMVLVLCNQYTKISPQFPSFACCMTYNQLLGIQSLILMRFKIVMKIWMKLTGIKKFENVIKHEYSLVRKKMNKLITKFNHSAIFIEEINEYIQSSKSELFFKTTIEIWWNSIFCCSREVS